MSRYLPCSTAPWITSSRHCIPTFSIHDCSIQLLTFYKSLGHGYNCTPCARHISTQCCAVELHALATTSSYHRIHGCQHMCSPPLLSSLSLQR
eukprot:4070168-Amphidinium_carterae.1